MGVDVVRYKAAAFTVSSMYAGLGGVLLALAFGRIVPESLRLPALGRLPGDDRPRRRWARSAARRRRGLRHRAAAGAQPLQRLAAAARRARHAAASAPRSAAGCSTARRSSPSCCSPATGSPGSSTAVERRESHEARSVGTDRGRRSRWWSPRAARAAPRSSGGDAPPARAVKTGPGATADTITLGDLTDLSGVFAPHGKSHDAGRNLYWDAKNKAGGICGRQVKLTSRTRL